MFVDFTNMPEDLGSLRLRLLFQYSTLIDWADLVGLINEEHRHLYEVRLMKANRAMVYATLCEMRVEAESLADIVRKYVDGEEATPRSPKKRKREADESAVPSRRLANDAGTDDLCHAVTINNGNRDTSPDSNEKIRFHPGLCEDEFAAAAAAVDILRFDIVGEKNIFLKALSASQDVEQHGQRIIWSIQDKDSFEAHLRRVQELVVYLIQHHTSDVEVREKMIERGREACLSLVSMANVGRDDDGEKAAALHVMQQQLSDLEAHVRARRRTNRDVKSEDPMPDIEKLLKFSLFRQKLDDPTYDAPEVIKLLIKDLQLPPGYERERRSAATLRTTNMKVSIEWKKYTAIPYDPDYDDPFYPPRIADKVVREVQRLCAMFEYSMLPVDFGLKRCLGLVHDLSSTRYGFVFEHGEEEIALERVFEQDAPELQSKVEAAKKLARSLLYLHAVGWLHKDISSANVLVASSPGYSMRLSGFEYSPGDEAGYTYPITDPIGEMYRHPDYRGPYRKTFDLYSLGIVLLEIAYWQPIKSIMGFGPQRLAESPENIRQIRRRILEEPAILTSVRKQMGERYCQAVEACIRGGEALDAAESAEGEADPVAGTLIQMAYTKKVVNMLKSIVV